MLRSVLQERIPTNNRQGCFALAYLGTVTTETVKKKGNECRVPPYVLCWERGRTSHDLALEAREQVREGMATSPVLCSALFSLSGQSLVQLHIRNTPQGAQRGAGPLDPTPAGREVLKLLQRGLVSTSWRPSARGGLETSGSTPAALAGGRAARLPEASAPPEVLQGPLGSPGIHGHHVRRGARAQLHGQPKHQRHDGPTRRLLPTRRRRDRNRSSRPRRIPPPKAAVGAVSSQREAQLG